jgi:hypothetical protein
MPLPQQQLAFVPVQLRREPALPCSFTDLQSIVQQRQALFNFPCDLTCRGEESDIMGHKHLRPGGAVSRRTATQERHSLRHITILDLDPPAKDRSLRTPEGETLLGRHRNQLVCPLIQRCVVSDEREQNSADCQARRQRRLMSQPPSLGDCCAAPSERLVGKAEARQDNPQKTQCRHVGVGSDLMQK